MLLLFVERAYGVRGDLALLCKLDEFCVVLDEHGKRQSSPAFLGNDSQPCFPIFKRNRKSLFDELSLVLEVSLNNDCYYRRSRANQGTDESRD